MRKLILEEWISLDGYAEDKKGGLDFFPSTEANKHSDADQLHFLETIDAILLGRKTYQLFAGFWPTASVEQEIIADKLNSLPKLIFSNTLTEAPWGKWPAAQIVAGDAIQEIKKLKKLDGKNMVMWGSLSLAERLMKENLVDEIHLQICPAIIAGGRLFFQDLELQRNLKLISTKVYNTGVVNLQYEPV